MSVKVAPIGFGGNGVHSLFAEQLMEAREAGGGEYRSRSDGSWCWREDWGRAREVEAVRPRVCLRQHSTHPPGYLLWGGCSSFMLC